MKSNKDFSVFILTHGRAEKVITYKTLKKQGYTGRIIILIDNEDKQQNEYKKIYKDEVYVFDKKKISDSFDEGDNFEDRRAIIYARNVCFDVAEEMGIKYFVELDDDYTSFIFKFNEKLEFRERKIKNMDEIFKSMLNFFTVTNAKSIAMAQNGDFIGGGAGSFGKKIEMKRKCMNSFFCSTDRKFKFFGRINEDVNVYTCSGRKGELFITTNNIALIQKTTQKNSGGMTDLYLDSGTYVKSFYSVMYSPSCVKVGIMGDKNRRLHHLISWKNAVPKILSEILKKK